MFFEGAAEPSPPRYLRGAQRRGDSISKLWGVGELGNAGNQSLLTTPHPRVPTDDSGRHVEFLLSHLIPACE